MNGDHAKKLLERMRNTQSGWGQTDLEHLFNGFGFDKKEGKKHTKYRHSKFPKLKMEVPRHASLKEWVTRDAVKIIDELIEMLNKMEMADGKESKDA